jgi:hypothetical protein
VLACETPARSSLVGDLERATLLDQVRTGNPPPWLRRIDADPASGQVLYEVDRLNELDLANGLKAQAVN